MKYWIRVLTNQNRELGTCLILMCDTSVLAIINTPDGFQRLASAAGLKINLCNNILLTSLTADSIGGFSGFSLAVSAIKSEKMGTTCKIGGPINMKAFCDSLRRKTFDLYWNSMEFTTEIPKSLLPMNFDSKITVQPIVLNSKADLDICSYYFEPLATKGNFKGDEAKKMGLKIDQIKQLVSGKTIEFNGKTITPKEMMTEPIQPKGTLILFIPDKTYLMSLYGNKQIAGLKFENIGMIYHSINCEVALDESYWEFIGKLINTNYEIMNIIDCKDFNNDIGPRYSSNILVNELHLTNPHIFPGNAFTQMHKIDLIKKSAFEKMLSARKIPKFAYAISGHDYFFWPAPEISPKSIIDGFHNNDLVKTDLAKSALFAEKINSDPKLHSIYQKCVEMPSKPHEKTFKNEPTIIVLGTMSQRPSTFRNVSGIYLSVPFIETGKFEPEKAHGILLDCGEGTFGQLTDHFCDEKIMEQVCENLRAIFISHYHGDHILGLPKIIKECDNILYKKYGLLKAEFIIKEKPLFLILPNNFMKFVELRNKLSGLRFYDRIRIIESESISPIHINYLSKTSDELKLSKITNPDLELLPNLYKTAPLESRLMWEFLSKICKIPQIYTFDVDHEEGSHAINIFGPNWKLTYSSDTLPCKGIELFGKNADLLIHECTFANNKLPKKRKEEGVRHTTLEQTAEIFDKVQPWRMMLTHFSGKYPKLVKMTAEHYEKRMAFQAFDHMQFKLSDAEWIHMLYPLWEAVITKDE